MALSVENQGQLFLRAVNSDFGVLRWTQEQRTWEVIDTLKAIAEDRAVPVSQVALAWVAGRPAVSSVILGARTLQQLTDNLGASELVLTDKENERLNLASQPTVDYPYGGMALWQRRPEIGGGWPER